MTELQQITNFLNKYLNIDEIEDKSWNGLQFEGSKEVEKVAFCVTAGRKPFEEILQWEPDMIVVHHGIFWKKDNPSLKGWMKKRVAPLVEQDVSLYASHLPLDQHEKVGNNAQLLNLLDVEPSEEFTSYNGQSIGWIGKTEGESLEEIVQKLQKELEREGKLLEFGPQEIKKIGVITGAGGGYVSEAIQQDLDLFITGEEKEIAEVARDGQVNVFFGGHYATETLGVKALKQLLQKKYDLTTKFFNFPTNL